MSLPLLLGALTLAPALCALLIAGLGVARFATKALALALSLVGLLVPVVLLLILFSELSPGNALIIGLFGGSAGQNDWFSAVYRLDGFGIYAAFGITIIVAPLLLWIAWKGAERAGEVSSTSTATTDTAAEQLSWAMTKLTRAQWGGIALALGIESTALTVVFADNILWLVLAWLVMVALVWGIGELGSDLDTIDRIGLVLMLLGPVCWAVTMLAPATGQHASRSIYPRLTDMMGRGGLPPLQVLILAIALTLAGAGYPFLAWIRRRALLVTPAGLVALALVLLPVALVVGARTYSAAQDANSSWQEIGQTAPPITAGIWFCILGMLTVCISGLLALGRRDSRTLIAFLAVAQVGWGLLALGAGDPTSMLGLVTLLATSMLGLGAMLAALFGGGTLTSDIEPDSAGPRPFGVPVQPLSLGAWIAGALTLIGFPLFGGFVALQMISASIIHTRGLAVPLLGTSWAGEALLGLALLRATAPAFTTPAYAHSGDTGEPLDNGAAAATTARRWNSVTFPPLALAPAILLGLLAILLGAIPQVLLKAGGLSATSALVQAGAANAALTTSSIGYRLEVGQWLPTVAWLAIIVLALLVLFALPSSLRETKPIYLAGMEGHAPAVRAADEQAGEQNQPEEISAELTYLPEPVETWSDISAAFTSSWLLPLNEVLLRGIDDEYPREVESPEDEDREVDDSGGDVGPSRGQENEKTPSIGQPGQPEVPIQKPVSPSQRATTRNSKRAADSSDQDQSESAGKPTISQSKPQNKTGNISRNTTPPAGSQNKNAATKKGDQGGGR